MNRKPYLDLGTPALEREVDARQDEIETVRPPRLAHASDAAAATAEQLESAEWPAFERPSFLVVSPRLSVWQQQARADRGARLNDLRSGLQRGA